jgi:hypothetical protein
MARRMQSLGHASRFIGEHVMTSAINRFNASKILDAPLVTGKNRVPGAKSYPWAFFSSHGVRGLSSMHNVVLGESAMKTLTALVLVTLVGCSSGATFVRKDALGGRLALSGAYMPAMADARVLMTDACNGRYKMVEVDGAVEFRCGAHAAPGSEGPIAARSVEVRRF